MSVLRRARAAPAAFALVAAALALTWGATAAAGLMGAEPDTGPARLVSTLRAGLPDASLGESRSERRSDRHGDVLPAALLSLVVVLGALGWRQVLADDRRAVRRDVRRSSGLERAPP